MIVYTQAPDVVMCDIGDSKALLDLNTSKYFKLNPSASVVWSSAESPGSTVVGIVTKMLEYFDVSAEQCEADVRVVITALCNAGLLIANEN